METITRPFRWGTVLYPCRDRKYRTSRWRRKKINIKNKLDTKKKKFCLFYQTTKTEKETRKVCRVSPLLSIPSQPTAHTSPDKNHTSPGERVVDTKEEKWNKGIKNESQKKSRKQTEEIDAQGSRRNIKRTDTARGRSVGGREGNRSSHTDQPYENRTQERGAKPAGRCHRRGGVEAAGQRERFKGTSLRLSISKSTQGIPSYKSISQGENRREGRKSKGMNERSVFLCGDSWDGGQGTKTEETSEWWEQHTTQSAHTHTLTHTNVTTRKLEKTPKHTCTHTRLFLLPVWRSFGYHGAFTAR